MPFWLQRIRSDSYNEVLMWVPFSIYFAFFSNQQFMLLLFSKADSSQSSLGKVLGMLRHEISWYFWFSLLSDCYSLTLKICPTVSSWCTALLIVIIMFFQGMLVCWNFSVWEACWLLMSVWVCSQNHSGSMHTYEFLWRFVMRCTRGWDMLSLECRPESYLMFDSSQGLQLTPVALLTPFIRRSILGSCVARVLSAA
jgi:hypothetical protein